MTQLRYRQQTQPNDTIIPHGIPCKPWQIVGTEVFSINNSNFLCIVDYHSKLPIVKLAERLSTESLIKCSRIMIFLKYGLLIVEVDFLWNRTIDSLKTSFLPLLWTSSGLKE